MSAPCSNNGGDNDPYRCMNANNTGSSSSSSLSNESTDSTSLGSASSLSSSSIISVSSSSSSVSSLAEQVNSNIILGSSSSSSSGDSVESVSETDLRMRVCDFSSDEDEDEDENPSVGIAYVNSSGRSGYSVYGAGLRLSEIIHQPVTAIPNQGGRCCLSLARGLGLSRCCLVPQNHPTVKALVSAMERFFRGEDSKSFLIIYQGDGGLFVQEALKLVAHEDWFPRVRVIGMDPSFFVDFTRNRHFYMSPLKPGSLLDFSGYLNARSDRVISAVPYSPNTMSAICPEVWDPCFEFALRMEFMRLAGSTSLSPESSPVNESLDSTSLQLVQVIPDEDCVGFQRLQAALREDMTSSVRSAHPFPLPSLRLVFPLTSLFRHFMTATKGGVGYNSWDPLNVLDAGFTASYIAGVSGEIFLLCTNGPRAQRLRLLRMLALLFSAWSWLMGIVELGCDYGVTIKLVIANNPNDSCTRNMLLWKELTLTPVLLLDVAQRYFPQIWDRAVGLGLRVTTPALYRGEIERSFGPNRGQNLVVTHRNNRYRRRHDQAIGNAVEWVALVCGAVVQLMFLGIDGFALKLPEQCRCNNTSSNSSEVSSYNITLASNNSSCSTWDIFPGSNDYRMEGSGARVVHTVRLVWCGFVLMYFLFTIFRFTRNSRRGN